MAQESKSPPVPEHLKEPLGPDKENSGDVSRNGMASDSRHNPPPAYGEPASGDNGALDESINLAALFESLNLSNMPGSLSVDNCLVHLKLMFAIQWMKEDVGFTDGLWGLWDHRAGPIDAALKRRPGRRKVSGEAAQAGDDQTEKGDEKELPDVVPTIEERLACKNLETLSRIREKRWALFVARAVDRYEAWWNSLVRRFPPPAGRLTEKDIDEDPIGSVRYAKFPTVIDDENAVFPWTEDMLPPLGKQSPWL